MKPPDELAGDLMTGFHRMIQYGDWPDELAGHLVVMLGKNVHGKPLWRRRVMPPHGSVYESADFRSYLLEGYPQGLGFKSLHLLHSVLSAQGQKGIEALQSVRGIMPDWDREVEIARRKHGAEVATEPLARHGKLGRGRANRDYNVISNQGNSESYLLRRLRRDYPEIVARVESGELSAYAAAVEAGIAHRKIQIEPTEAGFAKAIAKHLPGWKLVRDA